MKVKHLLALTLVTAGLATLIAHAGTPQEGTAEYTDYIELGRTPATERTSTPVNVRNYESSYNTNSNSNYTGTTSTPVNVRNYESSYNTNSNSNYTESTSTESNSDAAAVGKFLNTVDNGIKKTDTTIKNLNSIKSGIRSLGL